MTADVNLLFLNAGRRVELIRAFKAAIKKLNLVGKIVTTDVQKLAPGLSEGDVSHILPRQNDPEFITQLLDLCKREKVNMVIPLIDPDLTELAKNKTVFHKIGVTILCSDVDVIDICRDKINTSIFLTKNNFPSPQLLSHDAARTGCFPLFIKPREGSGSANIFKINSLAELDFFVDYVPNNIIQTFSEGSEYTVDVFNDFGGKSLIALPRRRLKVLAGEVSTGRIERNTEIETLAKNVAEKLGVIGPSNVQIIQSNNGLEVIEINPRFGGGTPLSIEAGAPFPEWTIQLALEQNLKPYVGSIHDGLTMMRYEQSKFICNQV